MRIYILRHGKAEGIAADGSDAGRRLTPEGREAVRAVLLRARAVRAAPELILSSPLQRAIETAELAREILSCTGEVEPTSALAPSASPYAIWEELRLRRAEFDGVLLVGHQPLIGRLVAFLLNSPSLELMVETAALAAVREETAGAQPRGVLEWPFTPGLAAGQS
ncbi:MAG TPA: phosphohistidine phosphatase SixA [Bryobacteraceae bacterium]|nr:phosphohistidine phosphatase SixA [Bryobacteraceae bacterium]